MSIIKRKIEVFKPNISEKKLEYSQPVLEAVLNPRITFSHLHLNGGWDWLDIKYGFIKLLLSRGQVRKIETHSDLLARTDYLDAAYLGVQRNGSVEIIFTPKKPSNKYPFASAERVKKAKAKYIKFVESKGSLE